VTDAAMDTPSYQEFAEGHFLTRAQMRFFWDAYAPNPAVRSESTASPLRATLEELRGLPEALVITADHDVLRDEGEAYARKLAAAGVPVTATRYPGTIHAFVVLNAFTEDPSPRRAIAQAALALRKAFATSRPNPSPSHPQTLQDSTRGTRFASTPVHEATNPRPV
jgi:acetyl esterase